MRTRIIIVSGEPLQPEQIIYNDPVVSTDLTRRNNITYQVIKQKTYLDYFNHINELGGYPGMDSSTNYYYEVQILD